MTKYLGLDYSEKKIGLAVTDATGEIIFPRPSLATQPLEKAIKKLVRLVEEEKIEKIIIGWPLNLKGETSAQTERIEKFLAELQKQTPCPTAVCDERLSTKQALTEHRFWQKSRKPPKDTDALAACNILNHYLAIQRHDRKKI